MANIIALSTAQHLHTSYESTVRWGFLDAPHDPHWHPRRLSAVQLSPMALANSMRSVPAPTRPPSGR